LQQIVAQRPMLLNCLEKLIQQFLVAQPGQIPANLSKGTALVDALCRRLLRLQVQGHRDTVPAKLDTVGFVAAAFAFNDSMRMAQANRVLTRVPNSRVSGRVGRDDIPDTTLLEALQPLPEGACASQPNQQRLINLDQTTFPSVVL
jgi:hypothetical protein